MRTFGQSSLARSASSGGSALLRRLRRYPVAGGLPASRRVVARHARVTGIRVAGPVGSRSPPEMVSPGTDELDNCEALCIPCHEAAEKVRVTRAELRRRGADRRP